VDHVARPAPLAPVIAERLGAQLLAGAPASSAPEVVHRLLAVQAQDARGARLAIRSRTAGLSAADVDEALGERSLLITWLNRGTLHLVASEDYAWLHALTTPPLFTANARRLAEEGLTPDAAGRGVALSSAPSPRRARLAVRRCARVSTRRASGPRDRRLCTR
jgi:hypothetical protein